MTEKPISIDELIKKHNIQPHDLEYILNFMQKESISPQLAMRRIKLFEKLQEKMAQSQSDDKVKELTNELDHLSKLVEDLQTERDNLQEEKAKLDKEIEDTRLEQDLFNAEREELKMQMHALMDSIGSIESEAEEGEEQLSAENKDLKKKISVMEVGCRTLRDQILSLSSETPILHNLVQNIDSSLMAIIEGKQIPSDISFSVPEEIIATPSTTSSTEVKSTEPIKESSSSETISPDQIQFGKPTTKVESQPDTKSSILSSSPSSTPKSKPVIKEKIFAEPEEIEEAVSKEAQPVQTKPVPATTQKEELKPKPQPKPEPKPKKIDVSAKPEPDGKQVSAKIEKILKLFISYAQQADNEENWKARISAICDMDEAYVELGGLAMSQIYAYQTQSIKKKKEFERLLKSWIENGLPR